MYKHLYDNFKHWYHGGSVYLYSDPHFSDDEMKYLRENYIGDEEQVKRINRVVGKNDVIIFLGDVGKVDFIRKIRGYKVLIMGNHDSGASNYKRIVDELIYDGDKYTDEEARRDALKKYPTWKVEVLGRTYEFHSPFNRINVKIDNCLFDEVYEGPLMISDKIMLSHEPIDLPFIFNIHGHDHSNTQFKDDRHYNMCAEHIDYTPVCIKEIVNSGALGKIDSIHRITIDNATERRKKRNE